MLVLVVGPSGAGKDTLLAGARAVLAGDRRFRFVRRQITRPVVPGDEDHEALDGAAFARRHAAGGYALSWQAYDYSYGIPAEIARDLAAGRVVVANVSRTVIAEAMRRFRVRVIEITAPAEVLARRIAARGRDDAAHVALRVARRVALPEGVDVAHVVNDSDAATGVRRLVSELLRAATG